MDNKKLPGWKILSPQTFKMNFVASMSQDGCEGVVYFHGTVDWDRFLIFLKGLLKSLIDRGDDNQIKVWIVRDNWAIHKTEKVNRYLKIYSIPIVTILPYSSLLNHCEHYIQAIKSKVKRDY